MKNFYTTTELSRRIAEQDSGCDIEILGEQLPEGHVYTQTYPDYQWDINATEYKHTVIPLHYPTDKYVVYAPVDVMCYDYEFRQRALQSVLQKTNTVLNVTTTVKRLSELTDTEIQLMGIDKMHLDDLGQTWETYQRGLESSWNKSHAKPRKTKDGYDWFPYRLGDVISMTAKLPKCEKEKYTITNYGATYKGLPLTIYANCWIEVHNWEKE